MNLFYNLVSLYFSQFLVCQLLLGRLQYVFQMLLRFIKEPARIVCPFRSNQRRFHFIRARNDQFSSNDFQLFKNVFTVFLILKNLGVSTNGISQVLTIIRKSFLINAIFLPVCSICLEQIFSIPSRPIFLLSLSFCILRVSVVFDFITCVSFCTEINNV